jgi:4'-phosphopantetheinyl transferase
MPLFRKLRDHVSSIFIWEVIESEEDLALSLAGLKSLRDIQTYRLQKRRIEKYVQTCLLLEAKIDPFSVTYSHNGKPNVESDNLHISFSHSGKYAALIVSNTPCGIDIEKENQKIKRISPKFLNEVEIRFLSIKGSLTWIWCIKEAVFKYFGEQVTFKDDIIINSFDLDLLTAHVSYKGVHGKGKFEIKLDRFENYYLAYTKDFLRG